MNTYVKKARSWVVEHKVISGIVILILAFGALKLFAGSNHKKELFVVRNGDINQKVIVNGKTKAIKSASLSFEVNGTVRSALVSIGSRVVAGQSLVVLDQSSLFADLMKARANVLSEQAKLDELRKGTRADEIAVYETELENAKVALQDAEKSLGDKTKDIINNSVDQLFSNPHTANPTFNLFYSNSQLLSDINNERIQMESILSNWNYATGELNVPKVSSLLEKIAIVVNSQSATPAMSQATVDGYKTSISAARAAILTSSSAVNTAKSNFTLAQKNLNLKRSGSTAEAIQAQEARVLQNQSEVQSIESKISKMTLRSPQNGIVTIEDAKVGEVVTPGKVVVSIISDNDLEIESNVSEINIGKVSVGNPVEITFDAFPGETFKGTVTYVEPAETIIDGVVNYKITVAFKEKYPQMKSGLTSKLEIVTGTKIGVLVVPQYSLKTKKEGMFVSKQVGEKYEDVPVSIGLRGQDGFVEVLSGISKDDTIESVATAQ